MAVLESPAAADEVVSGLRIVLNAPRDVIGEDQFLRLCSANGDLRLERSATGEIIIMEPAGSDTGRRNIKISSRLEIWSEKDGTGVAFDSSSGFTLPSGAVLAPDASWIRRERWDALPRRDKERFAHICPDFVVELRSPSDRLEDVRAKMRQYMAGGARLGWLIDPKTRTVEVYRPNQQAGPLKDAATVNGEDVLPGFSLDLAPVWP